MISINLLNHVPIKTMVGVISGHCVAVLVEVNLKFIVIFSANMAGYVLF
jgi:hypothetical protein